MTNMYAVVYGSEWEDIKYYTDLEKAKRHLLRSSFQNTYFVPLIVSYIENDGVMLSHDYIYIVNEVGLKNAESMHTYKYFVDNYDEFKHLIEYTIW